MRSLYERSRINGGNTAGFVFVITSGASDHPGYYVIGGSHWFVILKQKKFTKEYIRAGKKFKLPRDGGKKKSVLPKEIPSDRAHGV